MEARDFRGIGRAAQEELRRRAIVLVEQGGSSQAEAARVVGVQRQTVNIWLKRYRERGEDGLLDGRRVSGRKGKGALTTEEGRQVRRWIADKTPDQLKLPFALWTSRAVRELIERRHPRRLARSSAFIGSSARLLPAPPRQIRRLIVRYHNRILITGLRCRESQAAERMRGAITLIEHEWKYAQAREDKRVIIEIGPTYLKAIR